MPYRELLQAQREYFNAGHTRSYEFRLSQLRKLQAALIQNEAAIFVALQKDLGKSSTESYITELGLVLTELSIHIKKLKSWMRPQKQATNLLNLPSSTTMYYDPLGVVLIIAPWNYPFQLMMSPLLGAISGGNCAVLKPSEFTPATEALIERIVATVFPKEYVCVLTGDGAAVVPALMNSFRFDHVFFTGSIPVGKAVYEMAAKQLVPVTLELGGKSPTIVHADANLEKAAKRIVMGKWLNAGQTCIAPDYVLAEASIKDTLVSKMKLAIREFYGKAIDSKDYGRIVNAKRLQKLQSYLSQGTIVHGGAINTAALFMEPTIMEEVLPDSDLMKEEIFGPILPILSFIKKEDALQIVLHNSHPLAMYVFTEDSAVERWWIDRVPFGGGCINNTVFHFANDKVPFGGIGNSGIGGYHGKFSFTTFTHAKPVLKTPNWFEPKFKYPPFGQKSLKLFKWLLR